MTFKSYRRVLRIDLETFSETDLKKCGLYKYVNDPSFQILLFAYRYNNGPVIVIDLTAGEKIPAEVLRDLRDPTVQKKAHNAQFERVCLGTLFGEDLDPSQWTCTMIKCASLGLPMGLDHAAEALNCAARKDKEGKALINYFCKPCKPTKKNDFRVRNLPVHDPVKWTKFKSYNGQDVEVETAIDTKLDVFQIPETEAALWQLDQRINDRGVEMDRQMILSAIEMHTDYKDKLISEASYLTGLWNPNALPQLKEWLSEELDEEITVLNKDALKSLINTVEDDTVRRVLQIREETSKSSIEKYAAMLNTLGYDNYIRGILQFYGATRTGRWAGRHVQPHNLIRIDKLFDKGQLDIARRMVVDKDHGLIEIFWGSVSYVLSQLVRTAFVAKPGSRLIMSDFSQIESRVLAWVANELWKLDVFKGDGMIYEHNGVKMFGITLEQAAEDDWRQKSKIGELACGYQGGEAAIARMWPKHLPMPTLLERKEIVGRWRVANSRIKATWYNVQDAAIAAVETGQPQVAAKCTFYMSRGFLFCKLPSGRSIAYCKPVIVDGLYGPALVCHQVHPKTYQWVARPLYGGLLVENLVQGIARDLLGEKMLRLAEEGHDICFHVHDEVIIDASKEGLDRRIASVQRIMAEPVSWARGLPLDAKTIDSPYYKK